jgi:hypothetical protein
VLRHFSITVGEALPSVELRLRQDCSFTLNVSRAPCGSLSPAAKIPFQTRRGKKVLSSPDVLPANDIGIDPGSPVPRAKE